MACSLQAHGKLKRAGVSADVGWITDLFRKSKVKVRFRYYVTDTPAKQHIQANKFETIFSTAGIQNSYLRLV